MLDTPIKNYIKEVLKNMPTDWLKLTTHRLDIFNEKLAKVEFLEKFEELFQKDDGQKNSLANLPTAYDYIRLGHPLSCVLEWALAKEHGLGAENVISFSSKTIGILAILRKNLLDNKKTRIVHSDPLPESFDSEILKSVYGYDFEILEIAIGEDVPSFDGSTIHVTRATTLFEIKLNPSIDFSIAVLADLGSVVLINGDQNSEYTGAIQHVRRRETIAMTPTNALLALESCVNDTPLSKKKSSEENISLVTSAINDITGTDTVPLLASSGLSTQYAIVMGLVQSSIEDHPGKKIKIIVPTNCYGGTNDQARRVAACVTNVEVIDLSVDRGSDMVESIGAVLDIAAQEDSVPFIIAEIPTNPRVEIPDLINLEKTLSRERKTADGQTAIAPVFILDQTFCPNVHFLGDGEILSSVKTIAYVSGSKFPSGGLCTAGYCVANKAAEGLMENIEKNLALCDNGATDAQIDILAKQMPSMKERIAGAYVNARIFVGYISEKLPAVKINFVSKELAEKGFTPSVFSLDLPTIGETHEEREQYKRALNKKLINMMISEIPTESKYCVSYGQLKGCYWTIPATSTQGTTKEGDKDYIVRVSLSPDMDIEKHCQVFARFVEGIDL